MQTRLIKERINKIIDTVISKKLESKQQDKKQVQIFINEAYLQYFEQMLDQIIMTRRVMDKPIAQRIVNENNLLLIKMEMPKYQTVFTNKLISTQHNTISLYNIDFQSSKVTLQSLNFGKQIIRKNSSITFIDPQNCLIVGGSKYKNPNLKSKKILIFSTNTKQITSFCQLLQGLSSHSALFISPYLYIVGGNKNHNVVSKYCYKLNIRTAKIQQIASLNYPAASFSLCKWNHKFMYKIGGVGECFGDWDLSPYIQKYSIQQDVWEVINPKINTNCNFVSSFCLLAHSFSYVSQANRLIIMGGYYFNKEPSQMKFALKIGENSQEQHQLIWKGNFNRGGFKSNHYLYDENKQIFYILINQQLGDQKVLCINKKSARTIEEYKLK